jgi:hypothetical protein
MRKLTAGQKKALKQAALNYKREHGELPVSVDNFDYYKVTLPIDNMNPCEVFWQNANRYIEDMYHDEVIRGINPGN